MNYVFKTILDSIFHIIWKEGGYGGLCAWVVAPSLSTMETHISSSQAQISLQSNMASPTTFADQPKFWIHKSKPYFIAEKKKKNH